MVEWKTDGKCSFRVMSDGTTFTGKMADAYTKGNERERELLIIGWNEAMAQAEAEKAKLRKALQPFVFGDVTLNEILYRDMPDDQTGTITVSLGHLRAARAAYLGGGKMTDEAKIKHMVNRFLAWRLPDDFNPDGGISFKRTCNESKYEPTGTNLLCYSQAEEMVRHMLAGLPETSVGWMYYNPDTGIEFSEQHPVESGMVDDATNISPATAANLLEQVKQAWLVIEEERSAEARMGRKWLDAEERCRKLRSAASSALEDTQ